MRRTPESAPPDEADRSRPAAQRSAGPWPAAGGEDTDQGLDAGRTVPVVVGDGSGMGPDLFDLRWRRRSGDGGDEETRTPDPLLAKEMLYQLSYVPAPGVGNGGRFWTRTRDLCLIRAAL